MKENSEKGFYIKIAAALILTALIVAGLLYLIFTDAASKIRGDTDPKPTPTAVVTPSASPTPTPEETASPSAAPEETPSPTPEETPSPTPEETPSPTPEITPSPTPTPVPTADTVSDDSLTKVTNMSHLMRSDYVPADLVTPSVPMYQSQTLRKEAAEALEQMFADAKSAGLNLKLVSGYRSYQRQKVLWNTYVTRYGKAEAQRIDSYPGASEHITGLAVDIGTTDDKCRLTGCFAGTSAYAWLKEHCAEYGFIERYPDGKENVTGIKFSPWSYRYLGREEARKVTDSGLSMEEYYGMPN